MFPIGNCQCPIEETCTDLLNSWPKSILCIETNLALHFFFYCQLSLSWGFFCLVLKIRPRVNKSAFLWGSLLILFTRKAKINTNFHSCVWTVLFFFFVNRPETCLYRFQECRRRFFFCISHYANNNDNNKPTGKKNSFFFRLREFVMLRGRKKKYMRNVTFLF